MISGFKTGSKLPLCPGQLKYSHSIQAMKNLHLYEQSKEVGLEPLKLFNGEKKENKMVGIIWKDGEDLWK